MINNFEIMLEVNLILVEVGCFVGYCDVGVNCVFMGI